jgi:hypothetical protein
VTLTKMYGLVEMGSLQFICQETLFFAVTVLSLIIGFIILYNDNQIMVISGGVSAPCSG